MNKKYQFNSINIFTLSRKMTSNDRVNVAKYSVIKIIIDVSSVLLR